MKNKWNIPAFPCLILGFGGLGAALRRLMLSLCTDEKGLLRTWNLPQVLVAVLTELTVAAVFSAVRGRAGSNRYADNFGPSIPGGISAIFTAVGIGCSLAAGQSIAADPLAKAWVILGLASIPCMLFTGICQIRGLRPSFLFHAVVSLYLAIHLAHHYRVWSGNPELESYLWQLLASVGLSLTAYCRTAFDVGMGSRRSQLGISLITAYLCFLAMADGSGGIFYFAFGLWALLNLCAWEPVPRRPRPGDIQPPQEVPEEP